MGIDEVLREKRNEILEIATRHGASEVRGGGAAVRAGRRTDRA